MFPLKRFLTFYLAILPPGCPAVGASEELRGRLVSASRLDEPIKGFVVTAFWTVSLCLGKGSDLLLFLRGNKSGTTLGTKLQKLVSPERSLPREFILYPGISGKSRLARRCATLRGSGSLPNVQEAVRIFFKMV